MDYWPDLIRLVALLLCLQFGRDYLGMLLGFWLQLSHLRAQARLMQRQQELALQRPLDLPLALERELN